MSDSQIANFEATFASFDADGDGSISASELRAAMIKLGYNTTDAVALMKTYDKNGDGRIERGEFVDLMIQKVQSAAAAAKAFAAFDRDNDGFISPQELKTALASMGSSMTDDQVNSMIAAVDRDKDGKVNIREFTKMFESN